MQKMILKMVLIVDVVMFCVCSTADWLTQLVEYQTTVQEVVGSNPSQTNTQGLQITEGTQKMSQYFDMCNPYPPLPPHSR